MSGKNLSGEQFEQLPMFMQAKELHSENMRKGDLDPEGQETHADLMGLKSKMAEKTGLTESVRKHGVQTPVWVDWGKKTLVEGHHRVAAAHDINPEMWIPVRSAEVVKGWYKA